MASLTVSGTLNASNNVYWNNSSGDCGKCNISNNSTDASSNPLALPLAYYGGPTETYLPQPGSAAICAGSTSLAVNANGNALTTDQRGFSFASPCVDAGAVQTNYLLVSTNSDTSGSSCSAGSCSLRQAINAANPSGGDISFASSLYGQAITLADGTLTISSAMNIVGPGANGPVISGNNASTVFTVNSGAELSLYGLSVTNGNAGNGSGGGIENNGTLTLDNVTVSGNTAPNNNGGGIDNNGTLTLTGGTISGNSAPNGFGGGINNNATLTVDASYFTGNSTGNDGGGIYNSGGAITLAGDTFSGNSAQNGGGVGNGGSATIVESTFFNNSNQGGAGGAILNETGYTMSLLDSTVSGNSATSGGIAGGIYNGGTFTAFNSIMSGNGDDCHSCGSQSSFNLTGGNAQLSTLQLNGIGATLPTLIPLPGSPAICAGSASLIPAGVATDGRGYPNTNTIYTGYSASNPCVDLGAVQTNYTSVQFVQQPTNTNVNTAISPAPTFVVIETDSGLSSNNTDAVNGVPVALSYSGGASQIVSVSSLTETTAGGVATFTGIVPKTVGTGFTLSVGASGNGLEIVTGTVLTATSSEFNVLDAATHFAVSAPPSAVPGAAFSITVTALDSSNNTVTAYAGTVHFSSTDSAAVLPANATLTNGTGVFMVTLNTPGTETITATDSASAITGSSAGITVSSPYDAAIQVQFASTQLTYPGATNVTVCITPATNVAATGTVQIYDGSNLLATLTVQGNGCAYWYITPGLNAGAHVITAVYSGDANNHGGTSAQTTVNVASVPVNLSASCWNASFNYGANYQCAVNAGSNAGSALGSINYVIDGGAPMAASLTNGDAMFTVIAPAVGQHVVTITYAQQTNFAAAGPLTETFIVTPAAVNVQLVPSAYSAAAGTNITFTASVLSNGNAPVTSGSVSFYDGQTLLGVAPVNGSGQAVFSISSLPSGTQTITANYSGGANYQTGSGSATVTIQ